MLVYIAELEILEESALPALFHCHEYVPPSCLLVLDRALGPQATDLLVLVAKRVQNLLRLLT